MSCESIVIQDVGPRDGLQNQSRVLTPEQRVAIIRALLAAGVKHIQVGAFVSPHAVPAMADTDQVLQALKNEAGEFSVLVPNTKGYEMALAAGARTIEMVLYGTDSMAQANARVTSRQAENFTADILSRAERDGVRIVTTISVAFECPFDGPVSRKVIMDLSDRLLAQGSELVVVADSIGAAHPGQVKGLMSALVNAHGGDRLACHFHDTRAMGLANVYAAIEAGVRRFDASIAGLGGCPFAPGAAGNVATEDVVMMVEQMGFGTGIDLSELLRASALVKERTTNAPGGRAAPWLEQHLAKTA